MEEQCGIVLSYLRDLLIFHGATSTYFVIFGVRFSLPIWELDGSLSIFVDFLYCSVTKHTFLCAIWVQVLYGLIRKGYFLCAVWIVFLDLFAEYKGTTVDRF